MPAMLLEILDGAGDTVAEEIRSGLIAIRQHKKIVGSIHTVYLTKATIIHLAKLLEEAE